MQTMPEEWPSLTRMLSCRHSKKVSCETLSLSNDDLHSNLQVETQSFYYSDGEKDHMQEESTSGADDEANELENPSYSHYLQQARDLEKHSRKLDNPSYGDGKAAGHNFLARFFPFSKASHIPAASRAKEVERLRQHLRTYPSSIRRTGGVLPHSGGVLPHSGPILLHIASLSGNSKAPATLRAGSSIIPRNAVAGKMNPSGAGEPSSPKVNCCGRVRNKQKHIGKSTSVASNDSKEDQLDVGHASMLKRREKKKAHTKVVESASKKEKKTSRMGSGNAMVADHPVEQSKETVCDKAHKNLTAQNSGGKGSMSCRFIAKEESKRWSWRETVKHEESNFSYQHQQNWQETEASASSREFPVDLSRFGSERGHEMMVANSGTSLVGNDSQRFEQSDKEAPPQNALLLIRNRKAKDNPEVASSSVAAALSHGQETNLPTALGDHVMNKITSTQSNMPSSTSQKYDQYLLPLVEMKKPVTVADVLGHTSFLLTEGSSSTACKSKQFQNKISLQKEHSGGVHRQAPLPKPSPESSIWQRRAIEKPCALDIKKPMKAEINQRTNI